MPLNKEYKPNQNIYFGIKPELTLLSLKRFSSADLKSFLSNWDSQVLFRCGFVSVCLECSLGGDLWVCVSSVV